MENTQVRKQQILNRWTGAVLFECEIPAHVESGLAIRHALETAAAKRPRINLSGADLRDADLSDADLRGADLRDADLRGADLRGADLRGADLSGADLRGAVLRGADLRGADLRGADLSDADLRYADLRGADLSDADLRGAINDVPLATAKESIANLDKVREIILDNQKLLNMGLWHDGSAWRQRTCAEEAVCGTTHCLAGWLQVCSTDEKVRKLEPFIAGVICAPVASKMFYKDDSEVIEWLEKRKYVEEANVKPRVRAK